MRKLLCFLGLSAGLSLTAWAQPALTRGPYLQLPTTTGIVLRWRTDLASDSRVWYGAVPGGLSQSAYDAASTTEHKVVLSGLQPNTRYYYRIESANTPLAGDDAGHYFQTAPVPGSTQAIRAWVIGDFGKASQGQADVRDSYLAFEGGQHTDIWLWLGDNAYDSGTDQEFTDKVFHPTAGYPSIFPRLPFLPTPGNHDYLSIQPPTSNIPPANHAGPYYDIVDVPTAAEMGGTPSGMEAYYSYDWGNAHFVSANSEIGTLFGSTNDWIGVYPLFNPFASPFTSSPFTQWLHNDLSSTDKRWKIVYFHQPPFTDGSHESGTFWEVYMTAMRENILPILEQYDVDLVLCGHSHVYERSFLIKGHYDDVGTWNPATMLIDGSSGTDSLGQAYVKDFALPNGTDGTVYAVAGNGGSKDDNPNLQYPAHYYGDGCSNCYGSFVLDIHGDTLRGRYLKTNGSIGDDFTIRKVGNVSAPAAQAIQSLTVAPNPFEDGFRLQFTLVEGAETAVTLHDMLGRQVAALHSGMLGAGAQSLALSLPATAIPAGNYLLQVRAGVHRAHQKVVKLR
jgi:acid phosphatase type 7